ncbi:MAG: DUF1549 domain-containing protein [Verrucomicrobiales bacterium]|nr:DUF1549 domain-containing protein [Verrucomicrobiales bacterium]
MKLSLSLLVTTLGLSLSIFPSTAAEDFDVQKAAKEIDKLILAGLEKHGVEPNEAIDDETFVRRVYLDVIGRIPTIEEAENFHGSNYERKREQLITDLLESEGHMSRAYNFWADILRINRGLGGNSNSVEAAYQLWVKDAIKENKPYDEFVHDLVSAKGMIWDNGAIGYYVRDRGMPLDNMSNTVRVFLGTRLECAQCHDHPFDQWTQMDYYQMAAFSYGMDSRRYDTPNRQALSAYQREQRTEVLQKAVKMENFPVITNESGLKRYVNNKNFDRTLERLGINERQFRNLAEKSIAAYKDYDHDNRIQRRVVSDLYNPLQYVQTSENTKTLKLPHDYQYDDAKPHDAVSPRTMFGEDIDMENIDAGMIDKYADWMTSKENPTFTKVIVNRLWKHVFGHGVFEPVDELTEQTNVANPELLAYLEGMMRDLDYDMRKYQEVLFNTDAYQRGANYEEVVLGTPYHFQGPLLRRMSAEQIWDSIVALALPEVDVYRPRIKSQISNVQKVRDIYDALEERDPKDYIAMVEKITTVYSETQPKEEKIREKMYAAREAENEELYRKLNQELGAVRRESRDAISNIGYGQLGKKVSDEDLLAALGMNEMMMSSDGSMSMSMEGGAGEQVVMTKLPRVDMPKPPAELTNQQKKAWQARQKNEYRTYTNLVSKMARSSELESPAPRGHFLREFGQSDREVIENASNHASVPQALALLNGPIVESLVNEFAVFGRRVHSAGDPEEKTRMIFQAMLTREPTEREMELSLAEIEKYGDKAYEGLVWALLNTQQFIFVQ